MEIHLNGEIRSVSAPADMPLLWVLREHLNLTGAKYGCGHGVCGGCMVSIDGAQAHACQTTLADAAGKKVVTIEGQTGLIAEALFDAWLELDVAQCGFCQPAQITSAVVLLTHNPQPSDADIDEAMKHNLCRCATYQRVRQAIHRAASRVTATTKESA